MLNVLINMDDNAWNSQKHEYMWELQSLGMHSRVYSVPIVLVMGADVDLWNYARYPETYRRAQLELLQCASAEGLFSYTGMERFFAGGVGTFRGKLDKTDHIH